MRVLVFSDSHNFRQFMRSCIETLKPDAMIHLGDYYDDGQIIAEDYPDLMFFQVPGNCDAYRCPPFIPTRLLQKIGGVPMYLTHGHDHRVKQTLTLLLQDARAAGARAALFGHTHVAYCQQEPDGLWVMNPGSCGYYGGSAGLIEIRDKKITSCRLFRQEDLEGMK